MKLFDYLDDVRTRPVGVRRRLAIVTSASFCGLVFVAWLMVVTSRPATLHYSSATNSSTTPLSSVAEGVRSVTGELKALSDVIKNLGGSTTVVEPNAEAPETSDE